MSAPIPGITEAGWDIRGMRIFIVVALIAAAVLTLRQLLGVAILDTNKLEVGLLLGWLIAKSGTVIDWLFGGSDDDGDGEADQDEADRPEARPSRPRHQDDRDDDVDPDEPARDEQQARDEGYDIKVATFPLTANGKAHGLGDASGFVKLIADTTHGELLGGHLIGHDVSELLPELTLAQKWDLTATELARNVHTHPTLSEGVQEAIHGLAGHMINL